jgi:hypothetical protein
MIDFDLVVLPLRPVPGGAVERFPAGHEGFTEVLDQLNRGGGDSGRTTGPFQMLSRLISGSSANRPWPPPAGRPKSMA